MKTAARGTIGLIALAILFATLILSTVTSFVFWDWQWFWESNAGWRLVLVLTLLGGGSRA